MSRVSEVAKAYRMVTSPVRLLPDFIIIGAKKCGTSSLYDYLVEHPRVAPAYRKEIHFFDREIGGTLRYRAYFPTSVYRGYWEKVRGERPITGEATPYYLFHPHAPERVRKVVPDAKLIAVLRNPVDRAYSHYHHEVRRGTEDLSFEEAVEREAKRLAGEREHMLREEGYDSSSHRRYSYLARGVYVDQLKEWRKAFPEEQLLVLRSEDLFADPAAVMDRTLEFLGLSAVEHGRYEKRNEGRYEGMSPGTRGFLVDYFKPHNERLYGYLNRDFGWDR